MKTLNVQDQSFGIIIKLIVFRANGAEPRVSHAPFDTAFTGCASSRAFAHILGRAVLGQKRPNVGACVPMNKDDDNRCAQFKNAQKVLNKEMMAKERLLSSSQAKQSVLDFTSPGKRTVTA